MYMQLLDSKFMGYWVLETVLWALYKEQVNMRAVVRVELRVHAVVGQQVLGLLGVGDSDVVPDQGAGEHEGCGEGGDVCPCCCWLLRSWASRGWRQCCWP